MQEKQSTPDRKKQTAPTRPKVSERGCKCVGSELLLGHQADCLWIDYLSDLDEESEL